MHFDASTTLIYNCPQSWPKLIDCFSKNIDPASYIPPNSLNSGFQLVEILEGLPSVIKTINLIHNLQVLLKIANKLILETNKL